MEDRRLRVENWENKPDLAVAQNIGDIQSYIQIHCSLSEFQCTHVAVTSFFFSSRRLHTRSLRDWSSDVCSSDLAAKINDCECAVLHRKTPRQRPRFWRARHDQINPFGDFVVDAGASAALWFVLRVLQVFAQDDFGYPADDREFFRRKSLRHERPRSWPEVFGLGAGRSGQEGTLVREHVAQMIERRRVKARRQRCGCSLEFPPSQQRCAG